MGCDIHVEIEVMKNGKWTYVPDRTTKNEEDGWTEPYYRFDGRNYSLFGALAGVRTRDVEPISLPRHLPVDMSEQTRESLATWEGDAHSESFFTLAELLKHKIKLRDASEFFADTTLVRLAELDPDPDNVRMIFWFDN